MSSESEPQRGTRFEGYSDYERVSGRIVMTIEDALEAYAFIDSAFTEGAPVSPEDARDARTSIMNAAMMLFDEMRREQANNIDKYDDILDRWEGEDGYIARFHEHSLRRDGSEGWLHQFVLDIRSAGWKIGYLQAGRTAKESLDDPVEEDSEAMF